MDTLRVKAIYRSANSGQHAILVSTCWLREMHNVIVNAQLANRSHFQPRPMPRNALRSLSATVDGMRHFKAVPHRMSLAQLAPDDVHGKYKSIRQLHTVHVMLEGHYARLPCTTTADTTCNLCPMGTFTSEENFDLSCKSCDDYECTEPQREYVDVDHNIYSCAQNPAQ